MSQPDAGSLTPSIGDVVARSDPAAQAWFEERTVAHAPRRGGYGQRILYSDPSRPPS